MPLSEAEKSCGTAGILIDDCLVSGINYNSSQHFVFAVGAENGPRAEGHPGRTSERTRRLETMEPALKSLID